MVREISTLPMSVGTSQYAVVRTAVAPRRGRLISPH